MQQPHHRTMKPVFQQPMDGQCMRACIASIFAIPIEAAPRVQCEGHKWEPDIKQFICTIPDHKNVSRWTDNKGNPHENISYSCDSAYEQDYLIREWAAQFGLSWAGVYVDTDNREAGPRPHGKYHILPPGICIASGRSPRFEGNHAVVWDTRLTTFEKPMGQMVHDPAPDPNGTRPGLLDVQQFYWFEVEDPSLLHKLAELRP